MPQPHTDPEGRDPEVVAGPGEGRTEVWPLPQEEAFLFALLDDIFRNHWRSIVFGPLIQGAAYEFRCPCEPRSITLVDGYLTVHFGSSHFHLCIGENKGSPTQPTSADMRVHRRPSRAEFFRGLDGHGAPVTWGFRMANGKGEPQITIFFPNPFLTNEDTFAVAPDWSRLAVWETLAQRYLGRGPDPRDRTGTGFRHG